MKPKLLARSGWLLLVGVMWFSPLTAQESLTREAYDAQQAQAALQEQIDTADQQTRDALEELRSLERETRHLEQQNAQTAARLAEQAQKQQQRETALATLDQTRQALPRFEQQIATQLKQWIEQDLPFLQEERLARAASLQTVGDAASLSSAERFELLLEAWRAELEYGREMDAWRGRLEDDEGQVREVDYLRVGRVGLYYLSPNGRQGGVWRSQEQTWQALNGSERNQVREGLRLARDQRAPTLLTLPVSQPLTQSSSTQSSLTQSEADL
ncbi:DUF3450 domain-containing protein [Halomonas sp. Bachu 37]|uniref:DUF3450 domain-containing protein n=1 Tax=Halomonas kashgarensis TaxID=3084920 RepID=UPI0032168907